MKSTLLTPDDLSTRWDINTDTLSQWRWNGRGPHYLKIGRRIFYRPEDVDSFEEQQRRVSTSDNQLCNVVNVAPRQLQQRGR